ncbi:prepilin-type N-terminal cleavage/methylation domain-containing protein [Undibacterium sp. Di24W]|uniref:prepilin-type N-terminal cleavage/methylation domain-containing protein n=1 Tax=Undibacterium sp. Di24W TaxID=3413033 RepID=UPI003BF084BF
MKQIKSQQSGFTLIEIAIVLVIIGLLLGGVLKGQELIENSRIKSVVTDMRGVSSAFTGYFDRYRALAGDEVLATATGRGWTVTVGGNADGVLALPVANTFAAAGPVAEHLAMWQALRASGFFTGAQNAIGLNAVPRAATGGSIGAAAGPYGLQGPSVCVSALTHKQALGVDTIIDGAAGNNVGDARGAVGAAPLNPVAAVPALVAYNESLATTWTMCRRLQ